MKLNQDKVPSNLDEALVILKEGLTSIDIAVITEPTFDSAMAHFTVGMMIRNEWSMWNEKTILVGWFKENYGIEHADDVSGLILDCLCRDIRGEPRKDKELAKKFIDYWKNV